MSVATTEEIPDLAPVAEIEEKFRAVDEALNDAHRRIEDVLGLVLKMTNHTGRQNVSLAHLGALTFWGSESRTMARWIVDDLDKIARSTSNDLVATVREGGTNPNVPLWDESGVRNYDDDHLDYNNKP